MPVLCVERWMDVCLQIGALSPPRVFMWLSLSMGNILSIIIIIIIIDYQEREGGGRRGGRRKYFKKLIPSTPTILNTPNLCDFFSLPNVNFIFIFFAVLLYIACLMLCVVIVCIFILYTLCMYINKKINKKKLEG